MHIFYLYFLHIVGVCVYIHGAIINNLFLLLCTAFNHLSVSAHENLSYTVFLTLVCCFILQLA